MLAAEELLAEEPEHLADHLGMDAQLQQQRRSAVPKVVEPRLG
jgi:hypothetical protein